MRIARSNQDGFFRGCEYRAYVYPHRTLFGGRRWGFCIERYFVRWQEADGRRGFKTECEATAAANEYLDYIETPPERKYVQVEQQAAQAGEVPSE